MSKLAYHIQHYKKTSIHGIESHNWKKRGLHDNHSNKEIDTSLSCENVLLTEECNSLYHKIKNDIENRVTGRIRKDSNWLTEIICYPPDDIFHDKNRIIEYCNTVIEWHKHRFGKENIQLAVIHFDETTPHLHLDITPITQDGRLSAKDFFTRDSLREIHTDLANYLQLNGFSIERGEDTSDRDIRSRSVREYKTNMENVEKTLKKEIETLSDKYNLLASEHNRVLRINKELNHKNIKIAKALLNSRERTR